MVCNLLKISTQLSFVMRRSPVRVREVAQRGQKVRKCVKNEYVRLYLTCSFLLIYATFEREKTINKSTFYTRFGTKSVTKSVTF